MEEYELVKQALQFSRRGFIQTTSAAAGSLVLGCSTTARSKLTAGPPADLRVLPSGSSPAPVALPHFPDRLHAFVWRNWSLVPIERMASVVSATRSQIVEVGRAMGLLAPPRLTREQQRRSYITVIKRNWHLLPYEQLLALLGWTPEQLAYTLREDDFLFVKLGSLKPRCEPLRYQSPGEPAQLHEREIAKIMRTEFPGGVDKSAEPLFGFVTELSKVPDRAPHAHPPPKERTLGAAPSPRFCYSYFALYGDPLLDRGIDPYPEGYLARLAESGVDGVWLQGVLSKLAPFPWDPSQSRRWEERLKNLAGLTARARRHGIAVYLYLNEPRAMPLTFFREREHLKGVVEADHATLCTSSPEVQDYLIESVASVCRAAPVLGGFFTITASENLSNCWSHQGGAKCVRCGKRSPAEVIAEVNTLFSEGIRKGIGAARESGRDARRDLPALMVWDWGWPEAWAEEVINRLPKEAALMSVSEWDLPIQRGGVRSSVGEYSISAIGPGPRAQRHWEWARRRGLKTIAKIQAGNTWEISVVPYIPAVANVARHAANLGKAKAGGLMLGWTLGGYPSPNLEVIGAIVEAERAGSVDESGTALVEAALGLVARRRFGKELAPAVVEAWKEFSAAFSEFPFHIGVVYSAPLQMGPANLLWGEATGYHASMVGLPYDDVDAWCSVYPPATFIEQLEKVADGFDHAIVQLKQAAKGHAAAVTLSHNTGPESAIRDEIGVAEAAAIHFRSVANQTRFVMARRTLAAVRAASDAALPLRTLELVLRDELSLARRLHAIQTRDSRIGFEASNQYYYVPMDLAEKVLNCRDLLDRWLPAQRGKWAGPSATLSRSPIS